MISNLLMGCWAYSCYLNLQKTYILAYEVFLGFAIIEGLWTLFPYENTWSLLAYIINIVFYMIALFFVYMHNRRYRASVVSERKQVLLEKRQLDDAIKGAA